MREKSNPPLDITAEPFPITPPTGTISSREISSCLQLVNHNSLSILPIQLELLMRYRSHSIWQVQTDPIRGVGSAPTSVERWTKYLRIIATNRGTRRQHKEYSFILER